MYHVIQFNMKALHRIEDKTFFPWLRTQLSFVDDANLADSFSLVMDDLVEKQKHSGGHWFSSGMFTLEMEIAFGDAGFLTHCFLVGAG